MWISLWITMWIECGYVDNFQKSFFYPSEKKLPVGLKKLSTHPRQLPEP